MDLVLAVAQPASQSNGTNAPAFFQGLWQSYLNAGTGWFDGAVVVIAILGLLRGRKAGMSGMLLSMFQWIAIVLICGLAYHPLGTALNQFMDTGLLFSSVTAYIGVAIIVKIIFGFISKAVGQKLVGSDVFGNFEFYLGMLAGIIEFLCILIFALALLNARLYSPTERAELNKQQKERYSITVPSMITLQNEVFSNSYSGRMAKIYLTSVLIQPMAPAAKGPILKGRRDVDIGK
jgi:uncharacterized membrane protein required for colicin V production